MATTSPNFGLILATSADVVSVTTHVAGNFSALDTILSAVHTGTGQLKTGLTFISPTIKSPTISGTSSGATLVSANTGQFQTITATGGLLTVNTFNIGSYSMPSTIGTVSYILTVVTGNAQWAASAPNTGANQALSNLAAVAINTNLNTFSAGFVTLARVLATSGSLTGLTVFQAGTGTFSGNLSITGTVNANVVNCTGGAGTFGSVTVGTWALPATIGSSGQVMTVATGTASWVTPFVSTAFSCRSIVATSMNQDGVVPLSYSIEDYDNGSNVTTGAFTAPSSGLYQFNVGGQYLKVDSAGSGQTGQFGIVIASTYYPFGIVMTTGTPSTFVTGTLVQTVSSGAVVSAYMARTSGGGGVTLYSVSSTGVQPGYFTGMRLKDS